MSVDLGRRRCAALGCTPGPGTQFDTFLQRCGLVFGGLEGDALPAGAGGMFSPSQVKRRGIFPPASASGLVSIGHLSG